MKTLLIYALSAGSLLAVVLAVRYAMSFFRRQPRVGNVRHVTPQSYLSRHELAAFVDSDRRRDPSLYVTD